MRNIDLMVSFYAELFKVRVTDRGRGRTLKNELVFMNADPEHHHRLLTCSGRPPDAVFGTIMQLSLKAYATDDLRRVASAAPVLGATKLFTLNRGNALSELFSDPEGNRVEVYVTIGHDFRVGCDLNSYVRRDEAGPSWLGRSR